jgi:hypothetical protein
MEAQFQDLSGLFCSAQKELHGCHLAASKSAKAAALNSDSIPHVK